MEEFNPYICGQPILLIRKPLFIKNMEGKGIKTMNIDRDELFRISPEAAEFFANNINDDKAANFITMEKMAALEASKDQNNHYTSGDRVELVPEELSAEAELLLGNEDAAVKVDMSQDTPLTRWARGLKNTPSASTVDRKRKKSKMAKDSRKKNRKK